MSTSQEALTDNFIRRVLIVIGLLTAVIILVLFAWNILDILVLLLAGILLAVFLAGISGWIRQHTPLSYHLALATTIILLLALIGIAGALSAPSLAEQFQQLGGNLQQSLENVQQSLANQSWAQPILSRLPAPEEISSTSLDIFNQVTGLFSRTFNMFTNLVVILFIGLYLAFEPDKYSKGLIMLVPKNGRYRASEVLDELAYTLRWWLIGRMSSMAVIGLLSVIGLLILDMPLAFILGVLASLLAFIPIIGPILALVPATLVGFTVSPHQALYVFLLYLGIQVLESYFITPVIQRQTVSLPPVILILSQVIMGLFLGFMGVAVAAPFAAILIVLVKMLYIQDVLGDDSPELLKENP